MLKVPFFCEAPQDRFGALPCSWDHATIGEQACRDVSLVPLHSCSIFHGTLRSPIVLGFQGLLRIASEFVGLYQAARTRWKEWVAAGVRRCAASVRLKNGRADAPVRFDRDCVEDTELPCVRCVDPDRALFGAPPRSWDPHAIGEHVVPGRHLWFLYTLVLYSTAQRVLLLWGDYSIA